MTSTTLLSQDSTKIHDTILLLKNSSEFINNQLSYPVGTPPLKNYYNAQGFGVRNKNFNNNFHLGEDWNGTGGGNSDLGDPVYSIGSGVIIFAGVAGPGWGNVVMILHRLNEDRYIVSLYGHLKEYHISKGDLVYKRQKIGSIGNANGIYYAHLHFEIRKDINLPIGGGYSLHTKGYLHPTNFIRSYNK